jgi:small-conductance mechanosensitive channel
LHSALATVLMFSLLWGIQRATQFLLARLQMRVQAARDGGKSVWRWAEHAWLLVSRMAQLILAFLWVSVAYLWFTYVLGTFPLTQPFADKLSGFLVELLGMLGHGAITAVPGLLTVAVVLFLTKAVNDVVANVFHNVDQGRSSIPGIHKETASATRRLISILIWGFGLAVAYPYMPIADSEAFKGLSVMFGFMLTLGSAGIVTQLMSGLVLIYARALRVGDFVCIGEVTGVVKEMGVLSTKIINMRNEEITIPNAVLVGNPIKNYTAGGGDKGALISTTVTIGYDTPWRQVHAMLINAAEKTSGLRITPKPFVMQKGLQDFYVEYELYAYVDRPLERIQVLSCLHGNIQDEFNTYGVQIMSPHYVLQPKNDVVVEKAAWFQEPADKP